MARYVPFDTFPLVGRDSVPKDCNGWLIFLDEFNSAPLSVQAACYKLILDHQVGRHNVHPKALVVCAGNLSTNGAIVNRMGTAMQSRLIHLELEVTPEEWVRWGTTHGIDHRILAYISHVPENLHKFDPKHNDKTFACHRTWHFASKLIEGEQTKDLKNLVPLLSGTISEGVAHEFVAYTEVYGKMPTYQEIIANPTQARLDNEPGMQFAVTHMIAAFIKKRDLNKAILYLERLPVEFQTIALQNIIQRDVSMVDEKPITDWALQTGMELI